jgi:hypothetical protein
VRHDALLLKASFLHPHSRVRLHVSGKRVLGRRQDSAGRFHAFHLEGLKPDTQHLLQLFGADSRPLCDPWPLRTFPHPAARSERFRLLAYTCAGGSDMSRHPTLGPLFLPLQTRRRLLARAMALKPDAVIANGDHIYWDLRSASAAVQGRSPEALREVGAFQRDKPIFETPNERVLIDAFGPQIAGLYGTALRSCPSFFVLDDHDYTDNDETDGTSGTFPPDTFMRSAAEATQALYYPEMIDGAVGASGEHRGLNRRFGRLRYGRLVEALLYDCRAHVTFTGEGRAGSFLPTEVEGWLRNAPSARTPPTSSTCLRRLCSGPQGKWLEWYGDTLDDLQGKPSQPKPGWDAGWRAQHDRLLAASSSRSGPSIWLGGDLHASAAGRILRSGSASFGRKLSDRAPLRQPGNGGTRLALQLRGVPATSVPQPSRGGVGSPGEKNGFSLLDVSPEQRDRLTLSVVARSGPGSHRQTPAEFHHRHPRVAHDGPTQAKVGLPGAGRPYPSPTAGDRMFRWIIALTLALSSLSGASAQSREALVRDSFHLGFPVYEMVRTRQETLARGKATGQGGVNRFAHRRGLSDHTARGVTTPNNDTLYSSAWLDLSTGPVLLDVPASRDRYLSVALMDLFSDNFFYAGTRASGGRAGRFLVAGPSWRGAVPPGVQLVRSPRTTYGPSPACSSTGPPI